MVECWVVAAGKRTACVQGEIRLKEEDGGGKGKGKVFVSCVHDKAVFERAKL